MFPPGISPRFGALSPELVAQNNALFTLQKLPIHELIAKLEGFPPKAPQPTVAPDPAIEASRLATERLIIQRLQDPKLTGPYLRAAIERLRESSVVMKAETPLGEAFLNAVTRDILSS